MSAHRSIHTNQTQTPTWPGMKSQYHCSTAAALAAALLLCSLLLPTQAADCPPGVYHCKPLGASCKLGKVSECKIPLKCDKATHTCVSRSGPTPTPGPDDDDNGPDVVPVPINAPKCVLPVSPYEVRSGTPRDHEGRHPGDPNYKNVKAVDLVTNAGQAVYAVQDGELVLAAVGRL